MNIQQAPADRDEIHDLYLRKVNALVAADREHLIADLAAEYSSTVDQNTVHDQRPAA